MSSRRVPLEKRQRTETSCDKCKSRKQKCRKAQGQDACTYCHDRSLKCVTTQARKTRIYGSVEGLSTRLALLEGLVKGLLPEANLSDISEMQALGRKLGIPLPGTQEEYQTVPQECAKSEEECATQPDQQGQMQYIGGNSSFVFHLKLRTLLQQRFSQSEFVLFGRNAADESSIAELATRDGVLTGLEGRSNSESCIISSTDPAILDVLMDSFFESIHPDFPVLHEASFREDYENWWSVKPTDSCWLVCFISVCLLSRRIAPVHVSAEQERKWWSQLQLLLPSVVFKSSVPAIQALLLAALHLHHTNHRDSCWTLTGAAVRMAFAIGLHRDSIRSMQAPTNREFRKQLWWVLFAFEQIQVSSHDRPSAIEDGISPVGSPQLSITGMARHIPPDYFFWFSSLTIMMARACRIPRDVGNATTKRASESLGPLSPTARLLRDLKRLEDSLPSHLSLQSLDEQPQPFKRSLLLLHAYKNYIVTLVCRSALLFRATSLLRGQSKILCASTMSMSTQCIESGRSLCMSMLRLDDIGKFNALTWWDSLYAFSGALVLALEIVCNTVEDKNNPKLNCGMLLERLSTLVIRHLRNPLVPGTLRKWAEIVTELNDVTKEFVKRRTTQEVCKDSAQASPMDGLTSNSAESFFPLCAHDHLTTYEDTGFFLNDTISLETLGFDGGMSPNSNSQMDLSQHLVQGQHESSIDTWQSLDWNDLGAMILNNDLHDISC